MRARGDRVEGRARLVHEHDVGLDRERARDAQPLRLAAGQAEAGHVQPVLDLVPEHRLLAATARRSRRAWTCSRIAVDARPVGDVVVDGLGERVGLLEDHPDAAPDGGRRDVAPVQVHAAVAEVALHPGADDQVVHPVERAQHRGLAAAGRPDERGDLVLVDGQRDVGHRAERAVEDRHVLHVEDGRAGRYLPRCRLRYVQLGDDFRVLLYLLRLQLILLLFHGIPSASNG